MQHLTIRLRSNRYLMLAWLMFYAGLGWIIAVLPLGSLAYFAYPIWLALAIYSLLSRVLLMWPHAPKQLDVYVHEYGQVEIYCDKSAVTHWKFAWCSRRLVVLVVFFDNLLLRPIPRFIFWLSPHNTDDENHRYLRIIARFGHRLPLQYLDNPQRHID